MAEVLDVRCPTCLSEKGNPCRTVVLGGGSHHSGRVAKARDWERSLGAARKKSKQGVPGGRPPRVVEPLGDSSLVESFTLTVRCPNKGCRAAPGVRCNGTRVDWHAQRVKRGIELKRRYDNQ